jgi:DNA replication protein DnaC
MRLQSPVFISVTDFFRKLQYAISDPCDSEARVLKYYSKTPWLFLDDIGAKRGTDYVNEKLFELLEYRLTNDLPTCFTSDLDLDRLEKHFNIPTSEGSGRRLTERIVEMCEVHELTGKSWRLKPMAKNEYRLPYADD